jgi:branched-chain amino acid transport system substrate-binding protein
MCEPTNVRRKGGIDMRQLSVVATIGLVVFGFLLKPAYSQEPIKIGVMFPLTGPVSAQGAPERDAVKQAFEEENNTVAGRKIELLYEDSVGRPDVGLTKTKALVERDKVDLLLSELVSSLGAAMAPYVNEQKIPWVSTVALASLTRAQKSPYIFRFVPSSYQFGLVAAQSAKKMGWKKAYFIGWNAPPSREADAVVTKVFGEDNVLEPMFPNVGTSDYAPYLTKMDAKADGIFAAMWGSDSSRITQQYAEYGLNKKMPLFGIASFTSEEVLGNMPPESVGVMSAYTYCGTLDTPENKQFVSGYKARYNNAVPGSYQYMGYMAAKMVIQALKDINGRAEDKDAFIAALSKVQIKGPMGMASFDEHHGLVADFYPLTVQKGKDSQLENRCGERIAQVKDPYDMFP